MSKRHILIDACVAAAAFAPSTTRSGMLVSRAKALVHGGADGYEPQLLIPNFCIAETFAVLEKYRWGALWNPHVTARARLTPRQFRQARKAFQDAIHNGPKLLQVELNRYHVLCLDLISPLNAAYRIKRDRGKKGKKRKRKNVSPAKTYDLLFIAMGIWLQKLLGANDFVVATGDERIGLVVKRAKSTSLAAPMRRHLKAVARNIGLRHGAAIYPNVVDLIHANKTQLNTAFPNWNSAW